MGANFSPVCRTLVENHHPDQANTPRAGGLWRLPALVNRRVADSTPLARYWFRCHPHAFPLGVGLGFTVGASVAVGGTTVAVGTAVAVGAGGVDVGGRPVPVGGTAVAVGGTAVAVGGSDVAVGGTGVAVGGTVVAVDVAGRVVLVAVGATGVLVGLPCPPGE